MSQAISLSAREVRVLGCLLEKQRTTPDQYPLSLNALRLACNQSTNRDPVVDYDDATIRDALHHLERRRLVRLASGAGSRAMKYRHLLAEGGLPLDERERAVMTVLMLRGAQTPGELKQRSDRMHPFADLDQVLDTLRGLIGRELVERLGRRPGQKEERYAQLLGGDGADRAEESGRADGAGTVGTASERERANAGLASDPDALAAAVGPADGHSAAATLDDRLAPLERRLAALEREVAQLREQMHGDRHGRDGSQTHGDRRRGEVAQVARGEAELLS